MLVGDKDILDFVTGEGYPKVSYNGSKMKRQLRTAYYNKDVLSWILCKIKFAKYNWETMKIILRDGPFASLIVKQDLAIWYKIIGDRLFEVLIVDPELKENIIEESKDIERIHGLYKGYEFIFSRHVNIIYNHNGYPVVGPKNPRAIVMVKATI